MQNRDRIAHAVWTSELEATQASSTIIDSEVSRKNENDTVCISFILIVTLPEASFSSLFMSELLLQISDIDSNIFSARKLLLIFRVADCAMWICHCLGEI